MIIKSRKLPFFITAFFIFSILCSFNNAVLAQGTSSPYSRYGIGDVNHKVFGQGFAMGGTTLAMQNDTTPLFFINTSNPASYSGMLLTTAELGMNYNRIRLESIDSKKNVNNASFGYVSIAFPFKKWWGGSFGLSPYSSVGYNITDHSEITGVGTVNYKYEGSGGVSQAYFGTALKPFYGLPKMYLKSKKYARLKNTRNADHELKSPQERYDNYLKMKRQLNTRKLLKSFSFGGNASYLFGNIENTRYSIFSSGSTFNTRSGTTTRLGDVYFDYGFQMAYTIDSVRHKNPKYNRDSARYNPSYDSVAKYRYRDLKENVQLLFGATFAAQTDISAKIDSLSVNYFSSPAGYDVIKDTIEYVDGHQGTITLPMSFGVGIGFKKGTRWLVAADFAMQNWSSYQAFNANTGLKNSMRTSLGLQYVPDAKAIGTKNYLQKVHYRIGGHYSQTALELKSSRLTEIGLSAGLGLPVAGNYLLKSFSMVNIGVEFGERGTTNNGLVREKYFKTTLSFTINDRWFQKPKID